MEMPRLAVVIPVLNDSDALALLLAEIPAQSSIEVIVVDGGGDEPLESLVGHRPGTRLLRSARGRGTQLNAGAHAATAPVLLFLHADSTLPDGWVDALLSLPADVVGGWFRFALEDHAWQARLLERAVDWRVRRLGLPYGDQGLFVRRATFAALGGFPDWPLMEDVDFVRRLVSNGRTVQIPLALRTSSRRWRRDGWLRRSARNVALLTLFLAGVPPARLARWYGDDGELS